MSKITPAINTSGAFTFKEPWVASPGETYTISAITTLAELVRNNVEPRTTIYEPMGLVASKDFDWDAEVAENPFILTLTGSLGNVITIPDTYIAEYPNQSVVEYSRFLVSVDLGQYPSTESFEDLLSDIKDMCDRHLLLKTTTTTLLTLPIAAADQPTEEQNLAFQRAKKYQQSDATTLTEQVELLTAKLSSLQNHYDSVVTRLRNVGGIS